MTRAQLGGEHGIHGERKKASGGSDAVFANDHCAIMQRRTGSKNCSQEVVRKYSTKRHATFNISSQADLALDHDQRAGLILREKISGEDDIVVGIRVGR